jgi:2-oxoglutarate ferredoxin oxidoreductase subunit alpha
MPIFILSDLDLGMNLWMSKEFQYPDEPMDRGKVLSADELEQIEQFARYRDVDGDGIPYRTLPGTDHPKAAYFTRGTGHDDAAVYSERPEHYVENMERIARKLETARGFLPEPIIRKQKDAKVGLVGFGSTDPAILEAIDRLEGSGLTVDYMRLRAVPFSDEVFDFIRKHERTYVIEMNTDGQMYQLLQLALPEQATKLKKMNHNNGLPLSARWITESVLDQEGS